MPCLKLLNMRIKLNANFLKDVINPVKLFTKNRNERNSEINCNIVFC